MRLPKPTASLAQQIIYRNWLMEEYVITNWAIESGTIKHVEHYLNVLSGYVRTVRGGAADSTYMQNDCIYVYAPKQLRKLFDCIEVDENGQGWLKTDSVARVRYLGCRVDDTKKTRLLIAVDDGEGGRTWV